MTWIAAVAFGFGAMLMMKFTPNKIDWILIRVAALLFAGAGAMGATGWIGALFNTVLGWFTHALDAISNGALGAPVMWILATGLGALWIGALLPQRLFSFHYPDWLIFAGFPLPVLLASVPGEAGQGMRTVVLTGGQMLVQFVGGWFA